MYYFFEPEFAFGTQIIKYSWNLDLTIDFIYRKKISKFEKDEKIKESLIQCSHLFRHYLFSVQITRLKSYMCLHC